MIPFKTLLYKLKYGYGFDENSIKLLSDYFNDRSQYIPLNYLSSFQGSVLGPLLFLLFINDLPYFLKILFADDTTLGLDDYNYNDLLDKFNISIINLIQWYYYNKMHINWEKN
jgi:hypothetical protein